MAQLAIPITTSDHTTGSDDPVVTLIEYGDYQCPYCAAAQPVVQQGLARHRSRLLFAFRHFPLTEIHPNAGPAAETAEFAASHGLFWEMHEAIFANQPRLSLPTLIELAVGLNLSGIALRDALATGRFAPKVLADFMGGVSSGVKGTPTFFINGAQFENAGGIASLIPAIDDVIQAAEA
ncbi:MAG TPA: DsbA family protein [Acetobacteraceae bacterium]|nr:DsbA family protein [Acetobacteraceae bacterium]